MAAILLAGGMPPKRKRTSEKAEPDIDLDAFDLREELDRTKMDVVRWKKLYGQTSDKMFKEHRRANDCESKYKRLENSARRLLESYGISS